MKTYRPLQSDSRPVRLQVIDPTDFFFLVGGEGGSSHVFAAWIFFFNAIWQKNKYKLNMPLMFSVAHVLTLGDCVKNKQNRVI